MTVSSNAAAAADWIRPSLFAGTDIVQIAGLRWRPGDHHPVFEEDVWSFEGWADAPASMAVGEKRWRFDRIRDEAWRVAAKELAIAWIAPLHDEVLALPNARRRPLHPRTCTERIARLAFWLNWLTDRGIRALAAVSQDDCDRFLTDLRDVLDESGQVIRSRSPRWIRASVIAMKDLADYAPILSVAGYAPGFMPWQGSSSGIVVGAPLIGENTTPPIPDEVFRPVLANCLYLVDTIGPRLAELHEHAREQQIRGMALPERRGSPQFLDAIGLVLDGHLERAEPLPRLGDHFVTRRLEHLDWTSDDPLLRVNFAPLGFGAGSKVFRRAIVEQLRGRLEATAAAVGIEYPHGRDADLVDRADGEGQIPWTLPTDASELGFMVDRLQIACAAIVTALTGMRSSELAELEVGCRLPPERIAADLVRYQLRGTVIKGRRWGGEPDEWVVVEPAWRAVGLAERLLDAHPGQQLFPQYRDYWTSYRALRDWANSAAGQRLGLQHIPEYPITLRGFRRTLSLELAARPGGLLAAKVALKHLSVVTTEGYANRPGGAQAVFRTEWKNAEAKENLRLTVEAYHQYLDGQLPTGPGAARLVEAFRSVETDLAENHTGPANTVETDRQIELMLKARAATLHQGAANYCWFTDPSQALCLKLAGTQGARKPLTGMCDSGRCPQATHHARHRPVWATAAENTKVLLENPRVKKAERQRLHIELQRAQRVLDEINQTSPGKDH